MQLNFTKMHGCGNDYIYVDCRDTGLPEQAAEWSRRLSRRHFSVGADGVIYICPPTLAGGDATMRMFNADGSEGKMCGNAIRCVGKYLYESGAARREELAIETLSGVKKLKLYPENGSVSRVRVDMGAAVFDAEKVPVLLPARQIIDYPVQIAGGMHRITCVSMGNPHCVVFENPDSLDLPQIGALFENAPVFPERINTEFVQKIGERTLKMRVWERGSGETLACGTGACAAAAAAVAQGMFPRGEDITVQLRGGTLTINVGETVFMTGEAKIVFTGEVEL